MLASDLDDMFKLPCYVLGVAELQERGRLGILVLLRWLHRVDSLRLDWLDLDRSWEFLFDASSNLFPYFGAH